MTRFSTSSRNEAATAEFLDEQRRGSKLRFWLIFISYMLTFTAGLILGALANANS